MVARAAVAVKQFSGAAISSLNPATGPLAGGNQVVITGTGFVGVTAVKFGSSDSTSFTVNSSTKITATVPVHAAGPVDVTVATARGTSATSSLDQYTYVATPTVTALSPTSGPTAGGTTITITGTNLSGASAVRFGTTNAAGFAVKSSTQITATAPAHAAGAVDVTVATAGGTSASLSADQFTYVPPPTLTALSPTSGPAAGGTTVVILGDGFAGATSVKFGSTDAKSFKVYADTWITAVAPAGTGAVERHGDRALGYQSDQRGRQIRVC